MNKQNQKGGDNSTNIQAGEVTVVQGLDYPQVREVALDVFRSNFYELSGQARDIATERAEKITEEFLEKLQRENPEGFKKAEDPDFQYALFTVQKEYARTGDEDLGDLLVDLLVDRSKQEQRNILQIVLNESLNVAPKLTDDQLAALAVVFIFKYTQNHSIGNHEMLGKNLDSHVQPFLCVFRRMPNTDSDSSRTPIPIDPEQPFRRMPDTDSEPSRTVIRSISDAVFSGAGQTTV